MISPLRIIWTLLSAKERNRVVGAVCDDRAGARVPNYRAVDFNAIGQRCVLHAYVNDAEFQDWAAV
ncbi:MAG: hypothetical protein ACREQB_00990 [Candidatus Binataceae bacterium]